jgi:hypothetical protein
MNGGRLEKNAVSRRNFSTSTMEIDGHLGIIEGAGELMIDRRLVGVVHPCMSREVIYKEESSGKTMQST